MRTRDALKEIALDVGWKPARHRGTGEFTFPDLDPWVYLWKEIHGVRVLLHCYIREGSVWIGAPEDDRHKPRGPVLDTHMSDPESIIKIQKYLRDKC